MELWELVAREEIRDLVARYALCADRGRFDELVALFVDDGALTIDDREPLRGRSAIHAFLNQTRTALYDGPVATRLRHHVTTLSIDVHRSDDATGTAYFFAVSGRGPDHWGRYRDRYAHRAGKWLFADRQVRVEGFVPGSWAASRRAGA